MFQTNLPRAGLRRHHDGDARGRPFYYGRDYHQQTWQEPMCVTTSWLHRRLICPFGLGASALLPLLRLVSPVSFAPLHSPVFAPPFLSLRPCQLAPTVAIPRYRVTSRHPRPLLRRGERVGGAFRRTLFDDLREAFRGECVTGPQCPPFALTPSGPPAAVHFWHTVLSSATEIGEILLTEAPGRPGGQPRRRLSADGRGWREGSAVARAQRPRP